MFRAASAFFACLLLLCAASGARAQTSPSPNSDGVTVTLPMPESATAPSSALDLRAFGFLGQLASSAWLSGAMPSVQSWGARVVPSGRWFKSTQGVVRERPALRGRRAVGTR